ncbi:hypothetical protein [Clostridium sp.]|uniref:hypothetical protein n=1 Tax=Clostridium sp. TaxID=1506 RepID=UPI002A90C221|nr:hypothetical protein [Clostridium sp.]MDY6013155.1 hypothetical protein [Clostridium sp.]
MITKIKRCPARPKIPNKKTIFTLKVLSMSRRIENIIEGIKSEDIKELSIEESYIEDEVVVCVAKITILNQETIPIDLFKKLNEKLTEEDEKYLELIINKEGTCYDI